MEKRILVAVGDCIYSKKAVHYTAKISSAAKDLYYTLFNVQPLVPHIFIEKAKTDPEVKTAIDAIVHGNAEAARCSFEKFKDSMVNAGIPENRIEVVSKPMELGMAKDILNQAQEGGYEAIVLARRGLTPSRDFFIGTIAAKVVEHALEIPVWIAAEEALSMKFMVAVDGSENSVRVVDHLIYMLGAHPDLQVTLFHVVPHLRHYYSVDFEKKNPHLEEILQSEDKPRMEAFYERAMERLEEAGLKEGQIAIKNVRHSHDISTAILGEVRTGGYGTLVVGRRGEREAFFTGRIAMRLEQKITDQALWVIP
jgi:nucleotide-binding universal stress UspA family protein